MSKAGKRGKTTREAVKPRRRGAGKGAAFERETCKKLSLWVSGGKRDDLFWRSAMSGGRASIAFKKGGTNKSQAGDLCAMDHEGIPFMSKFMVECKFYRDLDLFQGVIGNYGRLKKFWVEANKQAKRSGKIPLLVAKQNNFPPLVITNDAGADELHLYPIIRVTFVGKLDGPARHLCFLEDFLSTLAP